MAHYDITRTVKRGLILLALATPCVLVLFVEFSNFASAQQAGHPMLARGGTVAAVVVILLRSICYGLPLPLLFCIPELRWRLYNWELQAWDIALIALACYVLPWWLLLAGVQQQSLITFAGWTYGYAFGVLGFIIVAVLNLMVWVKTFKAPLRFWPTTQRLSITLLAGHLILASVLLVCAPYYIDL